MRHSVRIDKLVLRPFKQRIRVGGEIAYEYAHGRFMRSGVVKTRQTTSEHLMVLLQSNPGVTARRFEELANEKDLGRNRARTFLHDGLVSKSIRSETAARGGRRFFRAGENDGK